MISTVWYITKYDQIHSTTVRGNCNYMTVLDEIDNEPNIEWIGTTHHHCEDVYSPLNDQIGCTDQSTMDEIQHWLDVRKIEKLEWETNNPYLVGRSWEELEEIQHLNESLTYTTPKVVQPQMSDDLPF